MKIGDLWIKLGLKKDEFDNGLKDAKKNTSAFGSAMSKIGSTIAGVFAVGAITGFVSNIIKVRSEFEKYEAVLTNTLGSNQAARTEMQMLQKFASETPFALTELTGAFVKLTNYGLKPSLEEMRKMGDLASSTGKGFDQLTEAIADATTGQYERLKEFGIKANKEGDKVTFTFKGQSETVKNTSQAIKEYILSLGSMAGVSGSMAAISQTLGGRISNLGDAWDGLLNTLGKGTSGIMTTVISWLSSFVSMLDMAYRSIESIKESVRDQSTIDSMNNALAEIAVIENSLMKNGISQAEAHKKAIDLYVSSINNSIKEINPYKHGGNEQIAALNAERNAVINHFNKLAEATKNANDTTAKSAKDQLADLKAINDELEAQRTLRQEFKGEKMQPITPIGTPSQLSTNFMDTNQLQLGDMGDSWKANIKKNKQFTEEYLQDWKDFTLELNDIISSGITDAISSLADGLGQLASGAMTGKEFGNQILTVIGSFMKTLGSAIIAMGVGMLMLNLGLESMNPGLLIAGGAALVAAGGLVSGLAKGGVKSSASAASSSASSGYSNTSQSSALTALSGNVVFELQGTTLRGVLNNQDRKNSLIR